MPNDNNNYYHTITSSYPSTTTSYPLYGQGTSTGISTNPIPGHNYGQTHTLPPINNLGSEEDNADLMFLIKQLGVETTTYDPYAGRMQMIIGDKCYNLTDILAKFMQFMTSMSILMIEHDGVNNED